MFETNKIRDVVNQLGSDERSGLEEAEAVKRRQQYGENQLKQKPPKTKGEMFIEQLNDPLLFILFMAAAVSLLLGEIGDMAIITVVILLNAVVGVVQEGKAMKALEALKKMTSPTALVKRQGTVREIPAKELVPGDIVALEAGRQVPADLRLLSSSSLQIEESALTGESVPVEKDAAFLAQQELAIGDRRNIAYMSTSVIFGRGEGIVIAGGMNTEIGKIAGMIDEAGQEATPLQKRLGDLGKLLSLAAVLLCVALFGIALLQQRNVLEMLITAISLAVAAVPEGLPAVVTIVLALSVSRMVKVNTIIRRLPSVETLGAVGIVCSDKTGTLTQNKMTVVECYMDQIAFSAEQLNKKRHTQLLEGFLLCNDASIDKGSRVGDPTELAFLDMGLSCSMTREELNQKMPRVDELPFDSGRKMMTTVHRRSGGNISYTKGSCDEILKRSTHILIHGRVVPITTRQKREIQKAMEDMAAKALRVLGLAMKQNVTRPQESGLIFVGMVGMIDPPRPEALRAIRQFEEAGVSTVMITGDHVDTAFAIARDLGIASDSAQCMSGARLDELDDPALAQIIGNIRVFARVSPEHKVRIVRAFRSQGHIVAMTGDGVNDAPSLKAADIGIAMGKNGTDVAKNASDLILTDDNFATIERAIEEGRGIYENIKKSVLFLLSSNFGEIITMFIAIIAGLPSPLKASHILWVNLITDSLPALALGVDENDKKMLMKKPPRNAKESLFAHGGLACTLFYGALIGIISLAAFMMLPLGYMKAGNMAYTLDNLKLLLGNSDILVRSQTYAFTVLGLAELFHAVGMRNVEKSIFRMNHRSNKLMIAAFFIGVILQGVVTEIPYLVNIFGTVRLSLREWGYLGFLACMPLAAHEILILMSALAPGKSKSEKLEERQQNQEYTAEPGEV